MPWKVVTIVWPALVAALLPLDLAHAIALLPRMLARLHTLDSAGEYRAERDRSRPHQVDDFRSRFASSIRAVG
jgi:hypothetical protein